MAKTFRASLLPQNMRAADCSGKDGVAGSSRMSSDVSALSMPMPSYSDTLSLPLVSVTSVSRGGEHVQLGEKRWESLQDLDSLLVAVCISVTVAPNRVQHTADTHLEIPIRDLVNNLSGFRKLAVVYIAFDEPLEQRLSLFGRRIVILDILSVGRELCGWTQKRRYIHPVQS